MKLLHDEAAETICGGSNNININNTISNTIKPVAVIKNESKPSTMINVGVNTAALIGINSELKLDQLNKQFNKLMG
jgi:hypothetical protein